MKSDDVTKIQEVHDKRLSRFAKIKGELTLLMILCRKLITFKMPWQYYFLGAMLWADGMLAGWLCSNPF